VAVSPRRGPLLSRSRPLERAARAKPAATACAVTVSDADALRGKTVAVPEARQLDVLAGLLERRGAAVLRCPLVAIRDAPDEAPIVAWLERQIASPPDYAVFYTG